MGIDYVDGARLAKVVIGGAQWVASKRLHLNEINVFPVPDGDTGTNLTFTLMSAADAAERAKTRSLGEVASAISQALLLGARGNAGIILAQFLRGFAREVHDSVRLYPNGFATALERSVSGAYKAMADPTEGTVLTVISESVREARGVVDSGETDFLKILSSMLDAASAALERTPELLPVLKEAGVVDAGGEGFVDLLEGMIRCAEGKDVGDALSTLSQADRGALPRIVEQDLKYRYCLEFLVEGPRVEPPNAKIRLAGLGGSLIAVGSPGLVRVHIHTNEPDRVLSIARELGDTTDEKIDDMREQHREMIRAAIGAGDQDAGRKVAPNGAGPSRPRAEGASHLVRIVTDSTADLPTETARGLGISVIPLSIAFADGSYADGVDLTAREFYAKLADSDDLPTTSQPSPQAFAQLYEELSWETKAVLSIHLSSRMSGTAQVARAVSGEIEGVKINVVDSGQVSITLGMVVAEAARAARRGADLVELRELVSDLCARARVYFTVGTLDYLARGGRIGRARAWVGKLVDVKPILTIEDGAITPAGRGRGPAEIMRRLVDLAAPELAGNRGGVLGILHADRADIVEPVEAAFRERFGFDDVFVAELGGIVGTHVGPGTWGVSYFKVPGASSPAREAVH